MFDTDWIIDGLNGNDDAIALLRSLGSQGAAVSVITLAEIFDGAYGSTDPERELVVARRFLAGFKILDVTRSVVDRFSRERARLRTQGNRIADFDLLIAATALRHDLTLVTNNLGHFERVARLKLYRRESAER